MSAKILVVEDDADTREMLKILLGLDGFQVLSAADGRTGLEVAYDERPDIIMTDINMPVMNGLEMIMVLRTDSSFVDVPIIAFTAYGNELREIARRAGADRTLPKPLHYDTIGPVVTSLLQSSKTQSPALVQ